MTVSTTKASDVFPGNNVATGFSCAWRIFNDTDVLVSLVDQSTGVDTPLVLDTDYTIGGAGNQDGFTVATSLPVATGTSLYVRRVLPYTQPTDFTNQGSFFPTMHEDAMDRLEMQIQQLADENDRAIRLPAGLADIDGQVPVMIPLAPLVINAAGTGVEAGSTALTGDMLLRVNLAATGAGKGAALVGFLQAGTGAVARVSQDKVRERVSLQDFGGTDDGLTTNNAAFTSAKTLLVGGTVKLPFKDQGKYVFTTASTDLSGVVLDPDAGVAIHASSAAVSFGMTSSIRTTKNIKLHNTDLNYDYQLSSEMGKPFDHKSIWLNDADAVNPVMIGLNLAGLNNESISWPSSDSWASATPGISTTEPYPFVNWNSLTASTWYASTLPVRGGDDISAAFDTGGSYNRLAVIRTTAGYYGLYAGGSGAAPQYITKLTGQASTTVTVGSGTQFTTQPQYYPENCVWTIRILDRRHFEVLLNGVSALFVNTAGDIYRAGFGVMPVASGATTMSVIGWTKSQCAPNAGKQPVSITLYGDSLTADAHGGWPYAMREALDGSNGCRVMRVVNNAVSGYNSTQALSLMQSVGVAGFSFCVIGIGTNDIQQGFGPTTTISNIDAMVAICNTAGCIPIIWIPPLWYTQTEAGAGNGQASGNSAGGMAIRSVLLRYCAVHSVACVDLTMVTGPIDVRFLTQTLGVNGADSMVRDNIHPTAYSYRLIGTAIARRILGSLVSAADRSTVFQQLNPVMLNAWTDATAGSRISYAVTPDGKVTLSGVATPGTATDGTAIFTLPEHLRPTATLRFTVMMNQPSTPQYTSCLVQIGTTGDLLVYGATSASYISLDGVSYYSGG
ncbi:GDSL-type esterase/lipase family protein [Rhodanobacter sp. FW102-FHT14D06]|uniref:GDSL-type esterase/lipase family protein n=2 Tax=unclassified Rhodanobacter TaxID=2621553 RepID=A0AB74URL6_9GAMM